MKVLQTLGKWMSTGEEGVFRYRRQPDGVLIHSGISTTAQATLDGSAFLIPSEVWNDILNWLAADARVFSMTGGGGLPSMRDEIEQRLGQQVLVVPSGDTAAHNQVKILAGYVIAILEHEGSIDLGGGAAHHIPVQSDIG